MIKTRSLIEPTADEIRETFTIFAREANEFAAYHLKPTFSEEIDPTLLTKILSEEKGEALIGTDLPYAACVSIVWQVVPDGTRMVFIRKGGGASLSSVMSGFRHSIVWRSGDVKDRAGNEWFVRKVLKRGQPITYRLTSRNPAAPGWSVVFNHPGEVSAALDRYADQFATDIKGELAASFVAKALDTQ